MDGIGPFFRGYAKRRINWSKIPFQQLHFEGDAAKEHWAQIRCDMTILADRAVALGFNAITLDDVAHLSEHAWFEPEIRERNLQMREEFRGLLKILQSRGLQIFLTADFLVTSAAVDLRLAKKGLKERAIWFGEMAGEVLDAMPELAGVILRIGESDGTDVEDPLRSRLVLRTAREVNGMLRSVLPEFERRKRRLIFRTWTVGAYLIGDLIWHRGRLASALRGIDSPAFVVSMKHGESDFFRYLPLNRHFFRIEQAKIIELQARREYEGAGEWPSFIGWDCERYARELEQAHNVIGLSVWCQTGGWHGFRRLAFLQSEAIWIELNASVAVRILRDRDTVENAVAAWAGESRAAGMLEFLRLADEVVRRLVYIEEFARAKLFFRRVRIPPLLHCYWDSIFINDAVRRVLGHFVTEPEAAIREGEAAFANFARMESLALELELPVGDVEFMRDTCALILLARRYYFLPTTPEMEGELREAKKAYKRRWPRSLRPRYRIRIDLEQGRLNRRTFNWLLNLMIRRQRGYRNFLDRMFTLTALSWIYRLFRARHEAAIPKFLRKTAMGIDSLLR